MVELGSIYWKYPTHPRPPYHPMSFGGKMMKMGREKGENVKEKERKGKE
jgi:hypothetical protein